MHIESEQDRKMAMVRERRHHQALTLTLPLPPPIPQLHLLLSSLPSPTSAATLSLSLDSLANLEKLSVVGHGGGGTVYKARHLPTSSLLALKVLRLGEPHDAVAHEADILRRVDSPYVVRCLAVLPDGNGDMCFAMEYMSGGSLRDVLLLHGPLPEPAIAVVAARVLRGLKYLHGIGVVHGDIKPSNLLVDGNGEVKIADFGGGGTCAYMSPERLDGEVFGGGGDIVEGFAGDVWGLGVVLLECYLGRFPLVGAEERPDWATLMYMVCFGGMPEVPGKASEEFRGFVGRCLEREWRRRGTVGELLAHPFVAKCCLSNSSSSTLI